MGTVSGKLSLKVYRKIPKISPEDLFEGLIFGGSYIFEGAHLRREICVSKSIELAL